jgi:hypothetical protein
LFRQAVLRLFLRLLQTFHLMDLGYHQQGLGYYEQDIIELTTEVFLIIT